MNISENRWFNETKYNEHRIMLLISVTVTHMQKRYHNKTTDNRHQHAEITVPQKMRMFSGKLLYVVNWQKFTAVK